MIDAPDIPENLKSVNARIAQAASGAGRACDGITLVAVSKTKPAETIRQALEGGHRVFGENRLQEALEKWPALKGDFPDVVLHLIGPLQRNKLRRAFDLFDVIETIDRDRLARALADEAQRAGRCPDCFVQVNTGEEPQKAGVLPEQADAFIRLCCQEYQLPIGGLMCIPPFDEEPSLHFALLREIAQRNELPVLSMGMTADYDIAIRFGATHIRVGTAIFGARPPIR
jgi:PLP dependent protein